jgi:hypothetical protein
MTTSASSRRPRLRYVVIGVVAIIAIAIGVAGPITRGNAAPNLSATDRIKADPPPTLFSASQIATIAGPVDAQRATARRLMRRWWAEHGTAPDDKAFLVWVEAQVPAPPSRSARAAELREVQRLEKTRTPAGIAAATWLEVHGKKDIWKLYQHDQRELESRATGKADKKDLKLILRLSKTAADTLAAKYRQSAPYVLDPTLRTDHTVKKGAVCPCSYPSRHAARAAGSRTFLGAVAPRRLSDYVWMEDQVTFSRLYMAGHVRSDITAGALLGDMVGEYVATSRGR